MIQSSPSPTLHSNVHSPSSRFTSRSQYDDVYRSTSKLVHSKPSKPFRSLSASRTTSQSTSAVTRVSIGTQTEEKKEHLMTGALITDTNSSPQREQPKTSGPVIESPASQSSASAAISKLSVTGTKRGTPNSPPQKLPTAPDPQLRPAQPNTSDAPPSSPCSNKRLRGASPAPKLLPIQYEYCNPNDLAKLISSMLMELIRYNDDLPINAGHLTRFHSRAPPGISVSDYLQRLTTHATLSPPILLSMVYYIDRLCALYPAFTISSLTVHRFLITSATVASKGLSDSFWTNKIYARVGGLSLKELALLELDFLSKVEWRIVPKPEVLTDYYRSLVERSEEYEIDVTGKLEVEREEQEARTAKEVREKIERGRQVEHNGTKEEGKGLDTGVG